MNMELPQLKQTYENKLTNSSHTGKLWKFLFTFFFYLKFTKWMSAMAYNYS